MKLPKPKAFGSGKVILIYQDPADEKRGMIFLPDDAQTRYRATVGTIVRLGDGYDADDDDWPTWEATVPYGVGTRVVWGRYQGDCVLSLPTEDDWWDSEEEKKKAEGKEEYVLIHVKDILAVLE